MEEFGLICMLAALFGLGVLLGNQTGTNDVSQKEIVEASRLCQSGEGLYKLNKGISNATAYCKNNDKFTLKGDDK